MIDRATQPTFDRLGQPQRVATINTNCAGGGAAAVARAVHEGANADGAFVSTFYYSYGNSQRGETVRIGSPTMKLPAALSFRVAGTADALLARNTRRYLSATAGCDLVHLHNLHGYYLDAVELLSRLDRPFVWTLHDSWAVTGRCSLAFNCDRWKTAGCGNCPDLRQSPRTWRIDRAAADLPAKRAAIAGLLARHPGCLVTPSRWLAERVEQSGVDPQRIRVIPNPVATNLYRPVEDKVSLRRTLGLPANKSLILLSAARLDDPIKGAAYMQQLQHLLRDDSTKHFVCVGAAGKGLKAPNTTVLGYISSPARLAQIHAACDLLASTSLTESFSLCVAEALSAGTPVVGFDVGALPELVTRDAGLLVPPGDMMALAEAVCSLLAPSSRQRLAGMAVAGRTRCLRLFHRDIVLGHYHDLYRQLLGLPAVGRQAA